MNFIGKSNPRPGLVTVNEQLKQIDSEIELILEHNFREREPQDSQVIELLKDSVFYWKEEINKTFSWG